MTLSSDEQRMLDDVREIIRRARSIAQTGEPGFRNRAVEIAAIAECLRWALEPTEAEYLIDIE